MDLIYKSTRGGSKEYTASEAVIKGIADDGGLFVPDHIPQSDFTLEQLVDLDYKETAYRIMRLFLTDYTETELRNCIEQAYDNKFDIDEKVNVHKACDAYFLELFHGPTIAFKDMALSILPHLMTVAAKKNNIDGDIVILTATSGDTGKAALAGFADVPGTRIIVFYPKDGVSPIQKKQMVTQKGDNTFVVGIDGNFDDAQTGVKKIFADEELKEWLSVRSCRLSSANSINIGRLIPQTVYYFYAYTRLVKNGVISVGDKINITVPTGNFGNILAAYYASLLGLPVNKFICASNENKVLFDFFGTGTYDRNREFKLTSSPSMDILISSNLERLIYMICDNDAEKCAAFMKDLALTGKYEITPDMRKGLNRFYGGFAGEEETSRTIKSVFDNSGYLIDPHTAVAADVYFKYRKTTKDDTPTVIASTASPYKFTKSVLESIAPDRVCDDDFEMADILNDLSEVAIPEAVESIRNAKILHDRVCAVEDMRKVVMDILG